MRSFSSVRPILSILSIVWNWSELLLNAARAASITYVLLGTLTDSTLGDVTGEKIYYDDDVEQIETLSPTAPHREVDLTIVEADKAGTYALPRQCISISYGLMTTRLCPSIHYPPLDDLWNS